jgi:hypothetical protein
MQSNTGHPVLQPTHVGLALSGAMILPIFAFLGSMCLRRRRPSMQDAENKELEPMRQEASHRWSITCLRSRNRNLPAKHVPKSTAADSDVDLSYPSYQHSRESSSLRPALNILNNLPANPLRDPQPVLCSDSVRSRHERSSQHQIAHSQGSIPSSVSDRLATPVPSASYFETWSRLPTQGYNSYAEILPSPTSQFLPSISGQLEQGTLIPMPPPVLDTDRLTTAVHQDHIPEILPSDHTVGFAVCPSETSDWRAIHQGTLEIRCSPARKGSLVRVGPHDIPPAIHIAAMEHHADNGLATSAATFGDMTDREYTTHTPCPSVPPFTRPSISQTDLADLNESAQEPKLRCQPQRPDTYSYESWLSNVPLPSAVIIDRVRSSQHATEDVQTKGGEFGELSALPATAKSMQITSMPVNEEEITFPNSASIECLVACHHQHHVPSITNFFHRVTARRQKPEIYR